MGRGLQELRALVVVAKEVGIPGVLAIAKRMLEKNMFLFGSVDINDYSDKERIKKLEDVQIDCMKKMHDELLTGTDIEPYLHMNLGMELDLEMLTKISAEYAGSKSLAIKEASQVVDVEEIRHLAEKRPTIGNEVAKINEEWDKQKELLCVVSHPEGESEHALCRKSSQGRK